MNQEKSAGRRNFLKTAAAGTAAIALHPGVGKVLGSSVSFEPGPFNKWPGRVAINFNKDVVKNDTIDNAVVFSMIDDTIRLLTGKDDVGEAWKSVFPETLSLTSKIAVKVVTYNPYKVGLNWQTVKGVTEGLQKMNFDGTGFPASNITIYELTTSPTANAFTVAGYTAANFPGIIITSDKSKKVKAGDGALNDREYAIALKEADFLINCFNARGHAFGDSDGKFTCGFKSHFGTYTDPNGMHGNPAGSAVSKNVREITCAGPVYKKHVLSVCGAIFASNEGNGPGGIMGTDDLRPEDFSTYVKAMDDSADVKNPSTVILTTDPVAAETQAIKILRINKNKSYAPSDLPAYVQSAAGIDKSGFNPTYNVGIMDESKMEIYRIINGEIIDGPVAAGKQRSADNNAPSAALSARQIAGSSSAFIEFRVPDTYLGRRATIDIFSGDGRLFRSFVRPVTGLHNHFSWNLRDTRGVRVPAGLYLARLSCGRMKLSAQVSVF